jgi:hypothetical protein
MIANQQTLIAERRSAGESDAMDTSSSSTDAGQIRAKKEAKFVRIVLLVQIGLLALLCMVPLLRIIEYTPIPPGMPHPNGCTILAHLPIFAFVAAFDVSTMLHNPYCQMIIAAIAGWEAIGVTATYFLRPQSRRLNIAKRICFVLLFVLPLLAFCYLAPPILTIINAIGPIIPPSSPGVR